MTALTLIVMLAAASGPVGGGSRQAAGKAADPDVKARLDAARRAGRPLPAGADPRDTGERIPATKLPVE